MYSKSKIYKIVDPHYKECYFGSTVQHLSKRMGQHRANYLKYKNGQYNFTTSFILFDKYGVDNCKIELVELFECKSKEELHQREGFFIRNNQCVNKVVPDRSKKEWTENNIQKVQQIKKQYYKDNRENIIDRSKDYYEENKQNVLEKIKLYRETHQDVFSKQNVCPCGGFYKKQHKATHEKTLKHLNFLKK